jgi:hypothetical protein
MTARVAVISSPARVQTATARPRLTITRTTSAPVTTVPPARSIMVRSAAAIRPAPPSTIGMPCTCAESAATKANTAPPGTSGPKSK